MNRDLLKRLAEDRAIDAEALLKAGRFSAAYYLVGYEVECALKACVLSYVEKNADVIFREKKYSENCWTHDIEALVKLSRLQADRDSDVGSNPTRGIHWQIAKDWTETARYQVKTRAEAEKMYRAVTDATNGVLPWIESRW